MACVVRSSLLVHLDQLGVIVAICYRPPKDNAALQEIMDPLQSVRFPLLMLWESPIILKRATREKRLKTPSDKCSFSSGFLSQHGAKIHLTSSGQGACDVT